MSRVPLYLDEPPTFLGLRPDEAVVFLLIFIPSFLMNWLLFGVLIGAGVTVMVKRWRGGKPEGFLVHFAYRHGIPSPVRGVPPSPLYANWYTGT